jgi:hypothetical protein
MRLVVLSAFLFSVSSAAPSSLVAVAAHSAGPGLAVYGRTAGFVLAEPGIGVIGQAVNLQPQVPVYLAYPVRPGALDRLGTIAPALFTDGGTVVVQLDEAGTREARAAGAQLVPLPEQPHAFVPTTGSQFPRPTFADSFIQRLVGRVSQDSIRRQIQRLQDFGTRFTVTESCRAAEQYVHDYFTALGFDSVELDTYDWQGVVMRNVVATRLGRRNPEKITLVCGHMDCYSEDPMNFAPGAEDNASGTVVAVEAARVMASESFDNTVKFIAFTGEELGLFGSMHYAEKMRQQGADIIGALNFDMIAWPGGEFGVGIYCDNQSLPLALFEDTIAGIYTSLDRFVYVGAYGSDQLSFHEYGYQATAGAEYGQFYPYYHTTADTIGNLSMPLAAEVAKMGIATLATIAISPSPPDSFRLWDTGSGGSLLATWQPGSESDLAGYVLYWGTASQVYTESVGLGLVSEYRVTGLANGTCYYATIIAVDSTGHGSGRAPEQSAIPGTTPLAPVGVAAMPFSFGMALSWQSNSERDLAGYNVHRSSVSGSGYVGLNPSPLTDTTFRDSGLQSDTMYFYVVTAVDTNANESPRSDEVKGKPITLDHGILLVDETRDGNGQRGNPSDAQQDAFYHSLLSGARYSDWDVNTESLPLAGDVGPYSTVVWHADDYAQQRVHPAVTGLANYLDHGGRLWLVGWKPILGLMGGGRYPYSFAAGQFPFDQLHLAGAGQDEAMEFTGATGRAGYPGIAVDSTKLYASFQGKLPFIDVLYPMDGDTVLTFISASGDSFQGKPTGVRWLAGPGKVVCFGFPMYYTVEAEARVIARKVLDDLGEPYGIEERTKDEVVMVEALPTVVRGVLFVPAATGEAPGWLLDAAGRRALPLLAGDNDLRRLPAGVYFVCSRPPARGQGVPLVRKVVIGR